MKLWFVALVLALFLPSAVPIELVYHLPQFEEECFYEDLEDTNVVIAVHFQIIGNGNRHEVGVELQDPDGKTLYNEKNNFGGFNTTVTKLGTYSLCFDNKFSIIAPKLIFVDFEVESKQNTTEVAPLTLMGQTSVQIYNSLTKIQKFQTDHRVKEAVSRKNAEQLNMDVFMLSLLHLTGILTSGMALVLLVKFLFLDAKPRHHRTSRRPANKLPAYKLPVGKLNAGV